MNSSLRIYYDETNNIRRLTLSELGLNAPADQTFVIAGIALKPLQSIADWPELRKAMRIQPSTAELKFGHVAPIEYEKALASEKLNIFLAWLIANDFLIHYSALDILYWSILDIIDSIILEDRGPIIQYHAELKNELYHAVRINPTGFMALMNRFSYPSLDRAVVNSFLEAVLDFVECFTPNNRNPAAMMLKNLLRNAMRSKYLELTFLHDNNPGELVGDFSGHFLNCIQLFKNATHIFDRETYIEGVLKSLEVSGGAKHYNYQFTDSKAEIGIQASDVVTGLLGRHFSYLRNHSLDELRVKQADFSKMQTDNLSLLRKLIDNSDEFSAGLFHSILPCDTHFKNNAFLYGQFAPHYLG